MYTQGSHKIRSVVFAAERAEIEETVSIVKGNLVDLNAVVSMDLKTPVVADKVVKANEPEPILESIAQRNMNEVYRIRFAGVRHDYH